MSAAGLDMHVSPEFLAEDRRPTARIVYYCSMSMITLIVALRAYSRIFLVKQFGWDDWLMTAAWALDMVRIGLSFVVLDNGAGLHIQRVMADPTQLITLLQYLYASTIMYMIILYLIRFSGLAFYHRLNPERKYTFALWAAFAFITATFLCQIFIVIFQCVPIRKSWDLMNQVEGFCLSKEAVFITTAVTTIVCDAIILILPISLVWNLQTSRSRKIGLTILMCFGAVAVVLSVPRTISIIPATRKPDFTWYYSVVLIWSEAEISTAILALSLPALHTIGKIWGDHLSSSLGSRYYSRQKLSGGPSKGGSRDVPLQTIGSGGGGVGGPGRVYRGPNRYDGKSTVHSGHPQDDDSERSLVYNPSDIHVKKQYTVDVEQVPQRN